MTGEPELSVVMATFNRAETIRETLRHLSEQTLASSRYEVIVIDDGSPDNTRAVVEEWQRKAPFTLTYLHHANRGPGYTQNRGLEQARAPIVLLMADDIFMAPGALEAHLKMHQANPQENVAVLGRVDQAPMPNGTVFLRTWNPFRFSDMDGAVVLPYYRFWACNISGKRDFIMKFGPFREQRGRGGAASHEDPELGYRLSRGNLQILYCQAALGFHHHLVSFDRACNRAYEQGLNFNDFRNLVGQPEIAVAYHVLSWDTLRDHLQVWFSHRRRLVSPVERNPALLLARYALRDVIFNALTIRLFWKPMLDSAESHPRLAKHMKPAYYRGVIAHAFGRGVRASRAWTPEAPAQVQRA